MNKNSIIGSSFFIKIIYLALTILLFLVLSGTLVTVGANGLAIDRTNFPDSHFQKIVSRQFDKNRDGFLSESEIADAKILNVNQKQSIDLRGIHLLQSLEELSLHNMQLSHLDTISHLKRLRKLTLEHNQINQLSLGSNASVTQLELKKQKIQTLDLRQNQKLKSISVYQCDALAECNVSGLKRLKELSLERTKIQKLEMKSAENLEVLTVTNSAMRKIDLRNLSNLEYLSCDHNSRLKKLIVKNNKKLWYVDCSHCSISKIEISGRKIGNVNCSSNRLKKLNVSRCQNLQYLKCSDNQIRNLVCGNIKKLEKLNCSNNRLRSLNVVIQNDLFYISCKNNRLGVIETGGRNVTVKKDVKARVIR